MTDQLLLWADYVVLVCENIRTIKKNMEVLLLFASKKSYSNPFTSLEWPRGFQEVKVSRLRDSGTG
jgi:hypothetical protein